MTTKTTKTASKKFVFTSEQRHLMQAGSVRAEQLELQLKRALGLTKAVGGSKRHAYVMSNPGAGKTYLTKQLVESHKVNAVMVEGAPSLNAFVMKVAYATYQQATSKARSKKQLVVWLDDSDSLFMTEDGLNVMKGAMDEERNRLVWAKNMSTQLQTLDKAAALGNTDAKQLAEALRYWQPEGEVGLSVDTSNVRFVVTSNKKLTAPSAAKKSVKGMHEAALRDRVTYQEYDVVGKDAWGWMAYTVMQADLLGLTTNQKTEVLTFMYDNWARCSSQSLRGFKDFAVMMLENQANYRQLWTLSLNNNKL